MPRGTNTAYKLILDWFYDGNTGSQSEIAASLGMIRDTVHSALRTMRKKKEVGVVDRRVSLLSGGQVVEIWGLIEDVDIVPKPCDVQKSIASQPEFVKLCNAGVSA